MKRFLLFSGDLQPNGGWEDFVGDYTTIDEAKKTNLSIIPGITWAEIIDTKDKKRVLYFVEGNEWLDGKEPEKKSVPRKKKTKKKIKKKNN
jgi:hypothetical protein